MTEVFVDKKVVGQLEAGIFTQRCTVRHIFRQYNAKGMDEQVYTSLKAGGHCLKWTLIFRDTGQVLTIPFRKIAQVGFAVNTGSGRQMMVKLSDFNEEKPVIQHKLF